MINVINILVSMSWVAIFYEYKFDYINEPKIIYV